VAEVVDVPPDGGLMRVPGTIPNRLERWSARQVFVAAAVCTNRRWAEPSPAPGVSARGGRRDTTHQSRARPGCFRSRPNVAQQAVRNLSSACACSVAAHLPLIP
jgi:hypothetical protein